MGKQVAGKHLNWLRTHFEVLIMYSAAVTKEPHRELRLIYIGEENQTPIEV